MEFRKNDLINDVLTNYYNTFSLTLDTCEFVPDKYNKEIRKIIFKEMKKKFKQVNKEYKKQNKASLLSDKMSKFAIKNFAKLFLFSRKKDEEKLDTNNLLNELNKIDCEKINKSAEVPDLSNTQVNSADKH